MLAWHLPQQVSAPWCSIHTPPFLPIPTLLLLLLLHYEKSVYHEGERKKNMQKNKLKIQLEIVALKYCQRCARVQKAKSWPFSVTVRWPFPQLIHGAFKGSFRSGSSFRNRSKLLLLLALLLLLVQMKRGITSVTSTGNYVNLSVSPCCCLPLSPASFLCLPRVCFAFLPLLTWQ